MAIHKGMAAILLSGCAVQPAIDFQPQVLYDGRQTFTIIFQDTDKAQHMTTLSERLAEHRWCMDGFAITHWDQTKTWTSYEGECITDVQPSPGRSQP